MADLINMLASGQVRPTSLRSWMLALLFIPVAVHFGSAAPVVAPSPYSVVPRAHITGVDRSFVGSGATSIPGAAVRAFQDPETESSGKERFVIRWYANSPGIPPGVVVLLESIQERNPVVKNHVLRLAEKSEGHIQSVIEIPSDEVRRQGRILKWRARLVWRGRLLDGQSSGNWEG